MPEDVVQGRHHNIATVVTDVRDHNGLGCRGHATNHHSMAVGVECATTFRRVRTSWVENSTPSSRATTASRRDSEHSQELKRVRRHESRSRWRAWRGLRASATTSKVPSWLRQARQLVEVQPQRWSKVPKPRRGPRVRPGGWASTLLPRLKRVRAHLKRLEAHLRATAASKSVW